MCFSKFEKFLIFNHSIYFSVSSSLFLGFQYPINETLFIYIFGHIQLCLRYQWPAEMLCGAFGWHLCFRYSNANAILCRQYSPLERKKDDLTLQIKNLKHTRSKKKKKYWRGGSSSQKAWINQSVCTNLPPRGDHFPFFPPPSFPALALTSS